MQESVAIIYVSGLLRSESDYTLKNKIEDWSLINQNKRTQNFFVFIGEISIFNLQWII